MDKKRLGLDFTLSFDEIITANKTFDRAKCAIAYSGKNRNFSRIEKEVFEAALPSIKNIPLVGNYDIETDTLGGHDIEIVTDSEGRLQIVNATIPFGVVPESATQWWENVDGTDYLFTDVLLWKRSPISDHIKKNQRVNQSMEINVYNGDYEMDSDGYCNIKKFEFEALCAIGVEPCFEKASIQIAEEQALTSYSRQFSLMLGDLKKFSLEGGNALNEKKFNEELDDEVVEEAIEESAPVSEEPVEEPIEEIIEESEVIEEVEEVSAEPDGEEDAKASFSKSMNAMFNALSRAVPDFEDGYSWLADFDEEFAYIHRVYWEGCSETVRHSYEYDSLNEVATIHPEFEKVVSRYLTLEEAEAIENSRHALENELAELNSTYSAYVESHAFENAEVEVLQKFKKDTEDEWLRHEIDEVLESFSDYSKLPEFEALVEVAYSMTKEAVEEKCFAIKGRHSEIAAKAKKIVLPINKEPVKANSPYGNIFK